MTTPPYTLTKTHESLVQAIYTSVGVSLLPEFLENAQPPLRNVKALWDTGATHSAISDRLADELELPFEDFADVSTAAGIQRVPIYPLRLLLPERLDFEELEVVEFAYSDEDDCDFIIGMDIITLGDLAISNFSGRTVFSFRMPAFGVIDFSLA